MLKSLKILTVFYATKTFPDPNSVSVSEAKFPILFNFTWPENSVSTQLRIGSNNTRSAGYFVSRSYFSQV